MSEIVALAFEEYDQADKALRRVQELQKKHALALEDACVVRKNDKGEIKLVQALNLMAMGVATGGCWGGLFGLLIGGPLGAIIGITLGALAGGIGSKLSDYGIADSYITEVSKALPSSSSALFMLVKITRKKKLANQFKGYGGRVLQTSLKPEEERMLDDSLKNRAA